MNELTKRILTGAVSGGCFFGAYLLSSRLFLVVLVAIGIKALLEFFTLFTKRSWPVWLYAALYPTLPIASLIYLHLRFYPTDRLVPLLPFIAAWVYDSAAYLIGSCWGRHKLFPVTSPKKSWEGLLGGFAAEAALCVGLFAYGTRDYGMVFALSIATIFTLLALSGDLFESWLKRRAGVKDAGNLLPGHGGILDRFDSVFFIALAMTLFLLFGEVEVKNLWSFQ